ncbi:phosphoglycerate mutase [Hydrogenophaga sp. OTU3427]|uniref:phosphoglycerate mutase n=1 Tax=Hydrogenophaga sp. OTU3427 TaxID=3043856 RepID=UPI00313F0B77
MAPPHSSHLLIPAAPAPDGSATPLPPHLLRLLRHLAPAGRIEPGEDSPALPHELLLAQVHGLPSEAGFTPWAAFESGTVGTPCAWVRPCHWQIGAQHVALSDPDSLALDAAQSEALMRAAAPYFAEDGITLAAHAPGAWLASGEVFRKLRTVSLDRVCGRAITPDMLQASTGHHPGLRRLQSEMQMLFYTHPVSDERQAQGRLPVNAFWITGAGVLPQPVSPSADVTVDARLLPPTRAADAAGHATAWAAIDADIAAHWLPRAERGEALRLTLGGERAAQTFNTPAPSLIQRLRRALRAPDTTFVTTL